MISDLARLYFLGLLVFVAVLCAVPSFSWADEGTKLEISGAVSLGNSSDADKGKDNWDKAAVLSQFIASVVIVLVGAFITARIQRTQISTNKETSDSQLEASRETAAAQIEASNIRANADRRIQEGDLIRQFLSHLKSASTLERELAIIALHGAIPAKKYFDIVAVIARDDESETVRLAAIKKLRTSDDPNVRRTLGEILRDSQRGEEERYLARDSAVESSLLADGPQGTIILAASSATGHAFESSALGGGLFTKSLIAALSDSDHSKTEAGQIYVDDLMAEVKNRMQDYSMTLGISHQASPHFSQQNVNGAIPLAGKSLPYSEISAIVLGSNGPLESKNIAQLQFAENGASNFLDAFKQQVEGTVRGTLMIGDEAKAAQVGKEISQTASSMAKNSLFLLYFAGHSLIDTNGELNLLFSDADIDSHTGMLSMSQINRSLARSEASVNIIILDTSFSGAATSSFR